MGGRLLRLLGVILTLQMAFAASSIDDALAVLPAQPSPSEAVFLLLTLANGDLVLLDADDGAVIWRRAEPYSVIVSEADPPGTPVSFADHAVVPGLDGTLFFDRDPHALDPVQVSVKELVERAPFQTRDGTRFLSLKQTEFVVLDRATGAVLRRFRADAGLDPGLAAASLTPAGAIAIGRARYTISAAGASSSWNLSYSETVALSGTAHSTASGAPFPDLFASASGDVWARDAVSGRVLWRTSLGSVPASALAVVGAATYKIHVRYAPDDDVVDGRFFGPTLSRLPDGQIVVVSNRPTALPAFLHPYDSFLAIAAPPSASALGQARLPDPESSSPSKGAEQQQRAQRDSVHITLNLPESPFWFSLMVMATLGVAVAVQAGIRRLASRWLTPIATSTTNKKKKNKKTASGADDRLASLTIGKIAVRTTDVLGVGSQGTIVFDGMFEGRSVAVKRLQKHLFSHATSEIALMIESDRHPSVLRYFAREDDANFIYVAVERCLCSLADVVAGTAPKQLAQPLLTLEMRPTPFALRILSDMVAGVEYLHALSIVHKDIKPANILITDDGAAKIADMGLSLRLDRDRSSFAATGSGPEGGSAGWYAPELMRAGPDVRLTRSVDIFSIGLVIYYVLTRGLHPFGESFERDANIALGRYNLDRIRHLPEAVDLIQATLSTDPQKRPLCTEVLRHPFFWSDEQKLEFLQEVSDRVEAEKPDSDLRVALESQAGRVVGRAWNRVIDPALVDNIGKYRKYQYDSVRDCLRVIRNKKNHYRDLPPEVQAALGQYPSGFLFYFTSRFPSLLLYTFAYAGRFCAHETPLSRHFIGLSDQLLQNHWQVWGGAEPSDDDQHRNFPR